MKNREIHLGKKHSEETKIKMSNSRLGKKLSPEHIEKVAKWHRGKKRSKETCEKISNGIKTWHQKNPGIKSGKNNPFWKGGITPTNILIRMGKEYKLWRQSVFARDNYTCRFCGAKGGKLNADHIKPFAYFPELRFAIDNGRTLCIECHKKTDTYLKNSL